MARVLVLKAGSAASNNLVRSLKAGDPTLAIVGCHDDPFVLKKSGADSSHVVSNSPRAFLRDLRRIIKREAIDLLIPTTDVDVMKIAQLARELPCRTFLPRVAAIERCQDKYKLTRLLRRRGLPAPLTFAIVDLNGISGLFRRLRPHGQFWCRTRHGTGSFAALPVTSPAQVRSWIEYWEEMRGVPPGSFTLSEYLPGRDFCVQCLWKNGKLILTKMAERITYIDGGSPSGVSSTPSLAKTAYEPHIVRTCEEAIRTVDRKASGVFFLDIKEAADGRACITEINAGRFATITNIHDLSGEHNMAALYVRLALNERVGIREACDYAEDVFLVRSVDTVPVLLHARELFESRRSRKKKAISQ